MTLQQLTKAAEESSKPKEQMAKIGPILADCFCGISEFFAFTSSNLALFVDLLPDPTWQFQVYMAGVGRMTDTANFDFIKHRIKSTTAMRDIYEAFGILNLLSPYRPTGSYLLKLHVYEERTVCRLLLELCKAEGWGNMTNIKLNGKGMDSVGPDFLQNLPTTGVFEGTY